MSNLQNVIKEFKNNPQKAIDQLGEAKAKLVCGEEVINKFLQAEAAVEKDEAEISVRYELRQDQCDAHVNQYVDGSLQGHCDTAGGDSPKKLADKADTANLAPNMPQVLNSLFSHSQQGTDYTTPVSNHSSFRGDCLLGGVFVCKSEGE